MDYAHFLVFHLVGNILTLSLNSQRPLALSRTSETRGISFVLVRSTDFVVYFPIVQLITHGERLIRVKIKTNELVAPNSYWHKHGDEIVIMHLLELFSGSHGVVHGLPHKAFSDTDSHSTNHPSECLTIGSECYWTGKAGGINTVIVDMTVTSLVTGMATEGTF